MSFRIISIALSNLLCSDWSTLLAIFSSFKVNQSGSVSSFGLFFAHFGRTYVRCRPLNLLKTLIFSMKPVHTGDQFGFCKKYKKESRSVSFLCTLCKFVMYRKFGYNNNVRFALKNCCRFGSAQNSDPSDKKYNCVGG